MSKVTPSALRGLSVAAGTVGLAAVGAAVAAAPAGAAVSGLPGMEGLDGGSLPLSTNALTAVKGVMLQNSGQLSRVPIAGSALSQLPAAMEYADFGGPQAETRSRTGDLDHPTVVRPVNHPVAAAPAPIPAAPVAPAAVPAAPTVGPPPGALPQAPAPAPMPAPPAAPPAPAKPPLQGVTDSLPVKSLPVVGGLAGGLPLLGGGGLGGLPVGGLG